MSFLFLFGLVILYHKAMTSDIMIDISGVCGVAFIFNDNIIALIEMDSGNIISFRNVTYPAEAIAVDKVKKEIYIISGDSNSTNPPHPMYKYDITLKNEIFVGNTFIAPLGLDFNENDGQLYSVFEDNIYIINPNDASNKIIGQNDADLETAILVTKDGNGLIIVDWRNGNLVTNTIVNPRRNKTVILPFQLPQGQTRGPESLDYLNDDPNDNQLVMCWGFANPLDCYIYDLDTQQFTPILTNQDLFIRGLDVLPQTMCTSLTVSPTVSPTLMTNNPTSTALDPIDDSESCPCFSNLDTTLKYCMSGCCDLGILAKTIDINQNIIEYGVNYQDKSCFVTRNYGDKIEINGLSDIQYYVCEDELIKLTNNINCTISDTTNDDIFYAFKLYFNQIGGSQISVSLIILYVGFIFMLLSTIIYCIYLLIVNIRQYIIQKLYIVYKPLTYTSNDITTDNGNVRTQDII